MITTRELIKRLRKLPADYPVDIALWFPHNLDTEHADIFKVIACDNCKITTLIAEVRPPKDWELDESMEEALAALPDRS